MKRGLSLLSLTTSDSEPLNRETLREALQNEITPANAFYTRAHFEVPEINASTWNLKIEGESLKTFTLDDLHRLPQSRVIATLECAGNGRRGFGKVVEGEFPWGDGAVGTAIWSGPQLSKLLEMSGLSQRGSTGFVYFEGLDQKKVREPGKTPDGHNGGKFVRYLPLSNAFDADVIVALEMNGEVLPREHGYPARLIVPDWYGMASVKWLGRIYVSNSSSPRTYFNDTKYVYKPIAKDAESNITPVTAVRVKSMIDFPADGTTLALNERVTVQGKAWSGSGKISRVELKTDSGWVDAEIDEDRSKSLGRHAWAVWRKGWTPSKTGPMVLYVRATDEKGNVQPDDPIKNAFQYGYNAPSKVVVQVSKERSIT